MGFFDFLKSKDDTPKAKSPKELARLTRIVSSKLSQDYDRHDAIRDLAAMANEAGSKALLKRFDFTMEPSITDRDEKEMAAAGIVAAGEAALPAIRAYCATAESLTWPLKVLADIVSPEAFVDELLELLELFDTEYVRNSEPKVQLIQLLQDHPSEDVRLSTEPFLRDVNEGVRFAAAATVFATGSEASAVAMSEALEEEESLRVKNRIAGGLADKGWRIPEAMTGRVEAALPPEFAVAGGCVVRR